MRFTARPAHELLPRSHWQRDATGNLPVPLSLDKPVWIMDRMTLNIHCILFIFSLYVQHGLSVEYDAQLGATRLSQVRICLDCSVKSHKCRSLYLNTPLREEHYVIYQLTDA